MATTVLLDTFTAADGTDPTARDMDVHPAGAARWQTGIWGSRYGVIESNAYTRRDAEYDCDISYDNPGGVSFTGAGTYCLLAHITASNDINWVGPLLYSNSTFAQINLQRQVGVLRVYVQGNGGPSSPGGVIELTPSTAAYVGQEAKCALFVDGTSFSAIINGAVVASTTKTFTEGLSVDGIVVQAYASDLTTPKPSISKVAIYQGLTLAEAIDLTTTPAPAPAPLPPPTVTYSLRGSMASPISIVSNALLMLGDKTIGSFDEASDRARIAANLWPDVLDSVLRSHTWNCAIKRVSLLPDATAPAFDYAYQYTMPGDLLRVMSVGRAPHADEWKVEGRKILSHWKPLDLRYVFRNEDTASYDALLVDALTVTMASRMAYAITQSSALSQEMADRAERLMRRARAVDGQDDSSDALEDAPLMQVRYV